jgi:hypothetical protein
MDGRSPPRKRSASEAVDDAAKRPRVDTDEPSHPGAAISDLLGVTADDVRRENAQARAGSANDTPEPESQAPTQPAAMDEDDEEDDGGAEPHDVPEGPPRREPMAREERLKRQEEDAKRYLVAQVRWPAACLPF